MADAVVWAGIEALRDLLVPIVALRLDPKNARLHGDDSIRKIRASLTRFGQTKPIVVDPATQIVRAGNGRVMAADAMGWTHIAAVTTDLSEAEQAAFGLADNRVAEHSKRRTEALLETLDTLPPDLADDTGYSADERAAIRTQLENEAALAARRAELQAQRPDVPLLTYTIVFDTKKEKATWDAFLKALVATYPSAPTNGAALVAFLRDRQQRPTE